MTDPNPAAGEPRSVPNPALDLPTTPPLPGRQVPPQTRVRMLLPLGGHAVGDVADVDTDAVAAYVAAGYAKVV